ncbi:MAG: response regulator [Planctomycetes bacterium]|nr:response regulator [Planctomycetota bacterium]
MTSNDTSRTQSTILVVDDHPANSKLATEVLRNAGYAVLQASDATTALEVLSKELPALILMDIALPGVDGLELTRQLKAAERTRAIPIVALTASVMRGDEAKARAAGCDGYLPKPIDTRRLPAQVAEFLERHAQAPQCILVVEDEPSSRKLLRVTLEAEGFRVHEARDGVEALGVLDREAVDAIISDILLPNMDGYRLCHEVRRSAKHGDLPFIVYTNTYTQPEDERAALELGADRFLLKPASADTIVKALRETMRAAPAGTKRAAAAADEVGLMKLYSERLIAKLEQRNQELTRRASELEASEARYRDLFDHAHDMIQSVTPEGRYLFVNPAWLAALGYTEADLSTLRVFDILHPDTHAHCSALFQRVLAGEDVGIVEAAFVASGGRRIDVEGHVSAKFEGGRPIHTRGIFRDVTERRRMQGALQELNADLERRVVARTAELQDTVQDLEAFTSSVSHDLHAPLRAIGGFAKLALEDAGAELNASARDDLQRIVKNTRRMETLVNGLLAFARLGRQELKKQPVDMQALALAAVEMQHALEPGRRVAVRIEKLPRVLGDPAVLCEVWANLIANAFKYTRPTPEPVVEIRARAEDGDTTFIVADNGVGFDMQQSARLFGAFERLHSGEEFEGSGLGLAIVRRIVERHGGRIWAESGVGEGARFSFTLPSPRTHTSAP